MKFNIGDLVHMNHLGSNHLMEVAVFAPPPCFYNQKENEYILFSTDNGLNFLYQLDNRQINDYKTRLGPHGAQFCDELSLINRKHYGVWVPESQLTLAPNQNTLNFIHFSVTVEPDYTEISEEDRGGLKYL